MKDLDPLHFFLGVEVKYFEEGIHLNQSKYVVELLAKTEITLARLKPVYAKPNFKNFQRKRFSGISKILYTWDSKLFHNNRVDCMTTHLMIGEVVPPLGDQVWATSTEVQITSKKQTIVARSSVEVECRALAFTVAELT
uniref:Reverse transcriptase Ty1/copia-type domain-containing protein n=1 Tax=Solanum lycopersicum TaxID=4081 RepID=A0A3Q7GVF2_SOLLC